MNNQTNNSSVSRTRSTFVTVVAWIFIALTGFSTVITGLQNIMIRLMFSDERWHQAMSAPGIEEMPPVARFMMDYMDVMFLGFFLVSALTFIASVGLLKRKNWARLIFIGVLSLGIVWNIAGLAAMHSFMPDPAALPHHAPAEYRESFEAMRIMMTVVSYMFAAGFSALFGWIIWKLTRSDIASEFAPGDMRQD